MEYSNSNDDLDSQYEDMVEKTHQVYDKVSSIQRKLNDLNAEGINNLEDIASSLENGIDRLGEEAKEAQETIETYQESTKNHAETYEELNNSLDEIIDALEGIDDVVSSQGEVVIDYSEDGLVEKVGSAFAKVFGLEIPSNTYDQDTSNTDTNLPGVRPEESGLDSEETGGISVDVVDDDPGTESIDVSRDPDKPIDSNENGSETYSVEVTDGSSETHELDYGTNVPVTSDTNTNLPGERPEESELDEEWVVEEVDEHENEDYEAIDVSEPSETDNSNKNNSETIWNGIEYVDDGDNK